MRFHTMGGRCCCGSARRARGSGAGFFWMEPGWPCGPEDDRRIRILEEDKHDLEQAAADVADLIRRVREDTRTEPSST
jgi:hypothetical protein